MSYCRWSSDNFRCDLYCYADCAGGWTTHVAGNRPVGEVPKVPCLGSVSDSDWLSANNEQTEFLAICEHKQIGLPHDGATFNDATIQEFLERLLALRAAGYQFPDYVLADVREEMVEDHAARGGK